MKRKKLILAAVLVTLFVLQCFSSPLLRMSWMYRGQIEVDDDDEEEYREKDPRLNIPDSVLASWSRDSLIFYTDSIISARAQDSLKIDSSLVLVAAADSVQSVVDSAFRVIFVKDSTIKAKIAFQHWFDSLPKKEQKKWILEHVKIPAQRRRADSILAVKDSIQAYKDSVIEATPRILETNFIPDSLQYKRLVLMTQDKHFGDFKIQKFDTTYNYNFYDYTFFKKDVNATWLGVAGSPVQYYNVSLREEEKNAIFFTPHRAWTYDTSTLPTYNTKTPYTELGFWGTPFSSNKSEEINVRLLTTQNITPRLNLSFELNKWGAGGKIQNQRTNAYHMALAMNYLGKRYSAHAGWIHDNTTAQESGGLVRLSDIRDTTLKSMELEVNLAKAESRTNREVAFINHNLRIPFGKDSLTTAFVGHTTEFTSYGRRYSDDISNSYGRAFYHDVFNINPSKSADTLGVIKLDNRIYLRMQPWKEDFFISKIDVGIGDKFLSYKDNNIKEDQKGTFITKTNQNNVYAYAGINGMVHQYFNWDARAKFTFAGYEAGDFDIRANAQFNFFPFRRNRTSPVSIGAHFTTELSAPDHYQQRILLNHFKWENNFKKHSHTKVSGTIDIPHWKLDAEVAYNIMTDHIYYDTLGVIRQSEKPVNVLTASLRKEFVVWKLHFDNRILLQFSSDNNIIPVPMLALNLRYFGQFDIVKNVLQMQIGANALFNTKWNMPSYNPELGVFHNQNEMKLGMCPYIDVFINMQWKRACIFLKLENVGDGWPMKKGKDYFSANHYIHTQRNFKLGILWPFYVRPLKIHRHDSGMGGGSSGPKEIGSDSGMQKASLSSGQRSLKRQAEK